MSMLENTYVTTGEVITTESGYLTGHGTVAPEAKEGKALVATLSGYVERVNKLISVKPVHYRYQVLPTLPSPPPSSACVLTNAINA